MQIFLFQVRIIFTLICVSFGFFLVVLSTSSQDNSKQPKDTGLDPFGMEGVEETVEDCGTFLNEVIKPIKIHS